MSKVLSGTWETSQARKRSEESDESIVAVKLVIEPIFEADFHYCSYGFRPGRNAQMAVEKIAAEIKGGIRCLTPTSQATLIRYRMTSSSLPCASGLLTDAEKYAKTYYGELKHMGLISRVLRCGDTPRLQENRRQKVDE